MRKKLSSPFVASAKVEPGAERSIYWDADLPGFGLQVTANNAKSFVVQYRAGKRSRRLAIKSTLIAIPGRVASKRSHNAVFAGSVP